MAKKTAKKAVPKKVAKNAAGAVKGGEQPEGQAVARPGRVQPGLRGGTRRPLSGPSGPAGCRSRRR